MTTYQNVLHAIGRTPLIKLNRIGVESGSGLLIKAFVASLLHPKGRGV
jgi:hypothetical protein